MVFEKIDVSLMLYVFYTYMANCPEKIRIRSIIGEESLTLVLRKKFAVELGIGKGDFVKCYVDENRLIVEKVNP
jgi:hypothetical protein